MANREDETGVSGTAEPFEGYPRQTVSPKDALECLNHVLQSETFKSAAMLRRLLEYIGTRSADGRAEDLKEYTIGVEALDRAADFDPKTDTLVRVHIHRLREKLSRYYLDEGREDDVLITIPRGHYGAVFLKAPSGAAQEVATVEETIPPMDDPTSPELTASRPGFLRRAGFLRSSWLAITLAIAGLAAGVFIGLRAAPKNTVENDLTPAVASLWSSFLSGDKQPIIGYPDAVFLIDETNDLLRYPSGAAGQRGSKVESHLAETFASNPELVRRAGPLYYEDGYTGTGEIESAATLASLFRQLGAHAEIKRSRDITIEDLQNHNVVLLGSSFQNKAVDELPRQGDFRFVKAGPRHELWDGELENSQPVQGEGHIYRTERDPVSGALRVDYGLVSFQPGLSAGRHIVILAGLDTTGTAGATKFATSEEGAALLQQAGKTTKSGKQTTPVIQAIVRCMLKDGNSIYGVRAIASHASEWHETNQ